MGVDIRTVIIAEQGRPGVVTPELQVLHQQTLAAAGAAAAAAQAAADNLAAADAQINAATAASIAAAIAAASDAVAAAQSAAQLAADAAAEAGQSATDAAADTSAQLIDDTAANAGAAQGAAAAAAGAAQAAADSLTAFGAQWLGVHAVAPAGPFADGALYFSSAAARMFVWLNGQWNVMVPGMAAPDLLAAFKTVDGAASGLDADLLDGQEGSFYQPAAAARKLLYYGRVTTAAFTVPVGWSWLPLDTMYISAADVRYEAGQVLAQQGKGVGVFRFEWNSNRTILLEQLNGLKIATNKWTTPTIGGVITLRSGSAAEAWGFSALNTSMSSDVAGSPRVPQGIYLYNGTGAAIAVGENASRNQEPLIFTVWKEAA